MAPAGWVVMSAQREPPAARLSSRSGPACGVRSLAQARRVHDGPTRAGVKGPLSFDCRSTHSAPPPTSRSTGPSGPDGRAHHREASRTPRTGNPIGRRDTAVRGANRRQPGRPSHRRRSQRVHARLLAPASALTENRLQERQARFVRHARFRLTLRRLCSRAAPAGPRSARSSGETRYRGIQGLRASSRATASARISACMTVP